MIRAFFILVFAAICAADAAPFYDAVKSDQFSPNSDILVQHYFEREGMDQIWLVSTADPSKRQLLFEHERNVTILFSPDEKWLVINNHCLSNEARLLLFRQKSFLKYEQVADLTDAAWQFFEQQQGRSSPVGFDHSYVDALDWTDDDSPTLLLSLRGHADSRNFTRNWYCLYDLSTKTFNLDFAAHNRNSTKLEPE